MQPDWFPRIHPRPATGWVNDPNGIGFWDERWHVMCQYNPGAATWGDIHWAHLSSADLVTWREEPAPLAPRAGTIDEFGVWSGVAYPAICEGETLPTLVYTAIPAAGTDHAAVALARPVREPGGLAWIQPDRGVSPAPPEDVRDIRDPFLFTWQGRRYAVQGAGTRTGEPLVLLYDATDLDAWRLVGPLLRGSDPIAARLAPGQLWECPQLVELDGTWVLILSLWDVDAPGAAGHGPQRVVWVSGSMAQGPENRDPHFTATGGGELDAGTALYAPQAVLDTRATPSRVLVWGWAWEGTRSHPPQGQQPLDWAGCLTVPRELSLREGRLHSRFAPEVIDAFGELAQHTGPIAANTWLARAGGGEGSVAVRVERHAVGTVRTVWAGQAHAVDLLFDGSILEVMADGVATTLRVYPEPGEVLQVVATTPDGEAPVLLGALR